MCYGSVTGVQLENRLTASKTGYTVGDLMALEKELAAYKQKLPELKEQEGKFALVHGDELVDVYSTYEDAIKEGYNRFKLEPFLVKQIRATEQILFISRIVAPETFSVST